MAINDILCPGTEPFYKLTNADSKTWMLPARNVRTALELYQPSGCRGILLKRLFPYLHRLPAVRQAVHAEAAACALLPDILELARSAFDCDELEYSIFGGTPSVHQKITIQFFSGENILGYAKVTSSEAIRSLFHHESRLLDSLERMKVQGIPRCLYCGQLQSGMDIFLQSTVKTRHSFSPSRWTSLHEAFLSDLARKTAVDVAFESSDFYQSLAALKHMIPLLPQEYSSLIEPPLSRLIAIYSGSQCRFSALHADFTPWNMFIQSGSLFVFDWEYGRLSYPPMLDRYHFHIQQAITVAHLSADEIRRGIECKHWFSADDLNSYLLDIISRFVGRENGGLSESLRSALDIWTKLLM